ncbi:MAG TPA: RNA polymerase sigma factor [Sphingobacteriaceae bacterium]
MPISSGISETELIQKCKEGDLKYQEKLYKHFYGYAMGIGMRYLSNRDDAMEVVNDSFIKLFNGIKSFNDHNAFKPWLRRIVVNTAIDRRRKDLKHLNNIDLDNAGQLQRPAYIIETLTARDILKLLDHLPAMQRVIFNLYEIDGYTHEEIAKMLSIPSSSSRTYLSRAKEKLKKTWNTQQEDSYERIG